MNKPRPINPGDLPPDLRAALAGPAIPLVTDTWVCPKGHTVKLAQGAEPRLMLGPGVMTPGPVCLACWLEWMAKSFPISKKVETETKQLVLPEVE